MNLQAATRPRRRRLSLGPRVIALPLAIAAWAALAGAATAQPVLPAPQNVVALSASATVELPQDWLTLVLATSRESADAATVQAQLKQALDAALAEARKAAKPGQVEVSTGGFSLSPRYGQRGTITGWVGSAELVLQGRDVAALSQLAGRVSTLTVARTGFSLSREAREKVEAEVEAQAIARFRARAASVSQQFGFAGYTVREVNIGTEAPGRPVPMMARSSAMAAPMAAEALPVEAGKATVTATVSGTVEMRK